MQDLIKLHLERATLIAAVLVVAAPAAAAEDGGPPPDIEPRTHTNQDDPPVHHSNQDGDVPAWAGHGDFGPPGMDLLGGASRSGPGRLWESGAIPLIVDADLISAAPLHLTDPVLADPGVLLDEAFDGQMLVSLPGRTLRFEHGASAGAVPAPGTLALIALAGLALAGRRRRARRAVAATQAP